MKKKDKGPKRPPGQHDQNRALQSALEHTDLPDDPGNEGPKNTTIGVPDNPKPSEFPMLYNCPVSDELKIWRGDPPKEPKE